MQRKVDAMLLGAPGREHLAGSAWLGKCETAKTMVKVSMVSYR